jgi:hypothetical protein
MNRAIILAALLVSPALAQRMPSRGEVLIIPEVDAPKPLNFSAPFDWRDKHIVCQPQTPERSNESYVYRNIVCRVIGDAA